jgi:hypothetical protein
MPSSWPDPYAEFAPRCGSFANHGQSWHERMLRRQSERADQAEKLARQHAANAQPRRPAQALSKAASDVLAALPPRSRKPGGRHRAGQRAPGRNPPAPSLPVIPALVLGVLRREWQTESGAPNPYRVRSLAALAVALAVPRGTTTLELCRMLPHEVLRLPIPREGGRWLQRWFRIRAHWLDVAQGETTPWLALPPMSRGVPRMIGWGVQQTLHRAGLPAWRLGQLLRAPNILGIAGLAGHHVHS